MGVVLSAFLTFQAQAVEKKDAASMMDIERIDYHVPALLDESMEALRISPAGVYVDATFGGGGHSRAILSRLDAKGRLFAFDQDADAEANAPSDDPRFVFVRSNFRYLASFLRYHGVRRVDGVLADLGVSSHHFDTPERGFSFRFDGEADMRMNNRAGRTAADVVNTYTEEQLADLLQAYGELTDARRVAQAIVRARDEQPIRTTAELTAILQPMAGRRDASGYYAQVFQALRIEVNDEMEALSEMLHQALRVIRPGGRLAVITYHSLEDRPVKRFMRSGRTDGHCAEDVYGNRLSPIRPVGRKPIVPTAEEVTRNPRVRSAKLRVGEIINEEEQ